MNSRHTAERQKHLDFETGVITAVTEHDEYFDVRFKGGGFSIKKPINKIPEVGQFYTLYLYQGSRIQGIDLNGDPVFYKTSDELEAERLEALQTLETMKSERKVRFMAELRDEASDFNCRLRRLPKVFQQRINFFFRHGLDFWDLAWVELVVCETAVKVAYACRSPRGVARFFKATSDEQNTLIPHMDDSLSGHQFHFACVLAIIYIGDTKRVRRFPGTMTGLTGPTPYFGR